MKSNFKKGKEAINFASKVLQDAIKPFPMVAKKTGLDPEELELFANINKTISNALKTRDVTELKELQKKAEGLQKKYKQ
mgnify:CR=1 FL=1